MKKILAPILLLFAIFFIESCEKADMKIKKLNHGDGTWDILSVQYEYYDSTGSFVVLDSTVNDPGELVFFSTTTLNGLFNYYLCVANINTPGGVDSYKFEVFFDEARAHFGETVDGIVPDFLNALWTVNKSNRKKQEWSTYALRGDGSLYSKKTITLKFK